MPLDPLQRDGVERLHAAVTAALLGEGNVVVALVQSGEGSAIVACAAIRLVADFVRQIAEGEDIDPMMLWSAWLVENAAKPDFGWFTSSDGPG